MGKSNLQKSKHTMLRHVVLKSSKIRLNGQVLSRRSLNHHQRSPTPPTRTAVLGLITAVGAGIAVKLWGDQFQQQEQQQVIQVLAAHATEESKVEEQVTKEEEEQVSKGEEKVEEKAEEKVVENVEETAAAEEKSVEEKTADEDADPLAAEQQLRFKQEQREREE